MLSLKFTVYHKWDFKHFQIIVVSACLVDVSANQGVEKDAVFWNWLSLARLLICGSQKPLLIPPFALPNRHNVSCHASWVAVDNCCWTCLLFSLFVLSMSSLSISLQVLHLRLTSPRPLSFLWASLNGELVFICFASQVPSWFEGIMYISQLVSRYWFFLAQEVKNKSKTPQTHKQHWSMSSPRALWNLGATTWHPRTHPRQWDWYDFSDQQFCPYAMPSVWFSKLFPPLLKNREDAELCFSQVAIDCSFFGSMVCYLISYQAG